LSSSSIAAMAASKQNLAAANRVVTPPSAA
jgi:hypothetical protein